MKLLNVPSQLTTKGERAEYLYSPHNEGNENISAYDCAVPQLWVDMANERCTEADTCISRHVVTVYYKDRTVRIMPITDYGLLHLATLATYA